MRQAVEGTVSEQVRLLLGRGLQLGSAGVRATQFCLSQASWGFMLFRLEHAATSGLCCLLRCLYAAHCRKQSCPLVPACARWRPATCKSIPMRWRIWIMQRRQVGWSQLSTCGR